MGGASQLEGQTLTGDRSKEKWLVLEALGADTTATPGQFSRIYRARSEGGKDAFLKATDISLVQGASDPATALLRSMMDHNFERTILEHCGGNRLDKVVTALDSGSIMIVADGFRDLVLFIVFELAEGDLRRFVNVETGRDLIWVISAIHNLTVAFSQIHGIEVFHNDFKPANALVFKDVEKIADFGRAISPIQSASHEDFLCAGDLRFAPPEQLYPKDNGSIKIDKYVRARAGDLYNLGSVIHFLITKRMLTPEIVVRLDVQFKPPSFEGGWNDGLSGVIPYWRNSFEIVMKEFFDDLPDDWMAKYQFALEEIKDVVLHLCDPDFCRRGDLQETEVVASKYRLDRIISRMDNLRRRVEVISRAR